MKFDKESMKIRFWELTDEIEAVKAKSADLRARAKKVREILAPVKDELKDVLAKITKIEEPIIPELKAELAILSRALGTKVGPRPEK